MLSCVRQPGTFSQATAWEAISHLKNKCKKSFSALELNIYKHRLTPTITELQSHTCVHRKCCVCAEPPPQLWSGGRLMEKRPVGRHQSLFIAAVCASSCYSASLSASASCCHGAFQSRSLETSRFPSWLIDTERCRKYTRSFVLSPGCWTASSTLNLRNERLTVKTSLIDRQYENCTSRRGRGHLSLGWGTSGVETSQPSDTSLLISAPETDSVGLGRFNLCINWVCRYCRCAAVQFLRTIIFFGLLRRLIAFYRVLFPSRLMTDV